MTFYFGEKEGDELMCKINLRDINYRAKQWDHPVKGLLKYGQAMKECGGNIFSLHKKYRECYCMSMVGLALNNNFGVDWWVHIPNSDPPDGLVMTLRQEKNGAYMVCIREVEVVEHRGDPENIFTVIRDKMVEKNYEPNTILVCLVLTPAIYDLQKLTTELSTIKSPLKHVFVVFTGLVLSHDSLTLDELQATFTMVQLRPVFEQVTLDVRPHINDFKERYDKGQESRLIENNEIYYGTANPKYTGVNK